MIVRTAISIVNVSRLKFENIFAPPPNRSVGGIRRRRVGRIPVYIFSTIRNDFGSNFVCGEGGGGYVLLGNRKSFRTRARAARPNADFNSPVEDLAPGAALETKSIYKRVGRDSLEFRTRHLADENGKF